MADTDRIKRNLGKMIDAGAPESDIDSYLKTEGFNSPDEWKAALNPAPVSDGVARSFSQGTTLGFGDELAAGVRAAFPKFSNWMMSGPALQRDPSIGGSPTPQTVSEAPTYDQRYEEELARERQAMKTFETQNPNLALGSEIAGNVAGGVALSALPGVGFLFRGGSGLAGNIGKGVAGGAALGGAQGFGQGEGGFDNRIAGAGLGASIGAAAGGAVPILAKGAGIVYEKAAPNLLNRIAGVADRFAPKVTPKSLSAAAPEGGQVAGDSWATRLADTARGAAGNVEEDAAISRLARVIGQGGVDKARTRLADLGEDAFIADVGKGTERLANVGYLTSDNAADKYTAAFTARDSGTGARFLKALGANADAPSPSRFNKFFEGYRSGKGAEIYDPVLRSGTLNVSDELTALSQRPSIKKALETVDEWAASEAKTLSPAERFHMVKQALNQNADAAFTSGKPINKKMVGDTAAEWEQALYAANPAIKEADSAYAKIASLPEWRDRGLNFMKRGYSDDAVAASADALADELPMATAQQVAAARTGASNVMADAARSGAKPTRRLADTIATNGITQQKLGEIYDPSFADALVARSRAELDFAARQNRILAGSPTAERHAALARETALSPVPQSGGDFGRIFDWVKDTLAKTDRASEPVRARLADLLANPDAAANAETLSLVEALLKRQAATPRLSPGIAGAAGGSLSSP